MPTLCESLRFNGTATRSSDEVELLTHQECIYYAVSLSEYCAGHSIRLEDYEASDYINAILSMYSYELDIDSPCKYGFSIAVS